MAGRAIDDTGAVRALRAAEGLLHAGTKDWGPQPPLTDPIAAWRTLGRPHTLIVLRGPTSRGLRRVWVTPDGGWGADEALLPAAGDVPAADLGAALLPVPLIASLAAAGPADDLVVAASEDLRGVAWPMLPVPGFHSERLNAVAAVTLLPSLSWGARLAEAGTRGSPAAAVYSYVHPDLGLDLARVQLQRRRAVACADLSALAASLNAAPAAGTVLIGSHATLTGDGSVDLRDHIGTVVPPEALARWRLPRVSVIVGCRTGTSNRTAPLHLAEAALIAGSSHVVAAVSRTTDEVVDIVTAATVALLHTGAGGAGLAPSQALQAALQQYDRAYPSDRADLTAWPFVHWGLPGSAARR